MTTRRTLFAVAVAVSAALAAACSSGSSSSTTTSTTTAPSASSTSSTATPSTKAPASSTHCRSENIRGSLGQTESGAGQRYVALVLTNTGTTTCELRGFPGVSLLDRSGNQIGAAAGREGAEGPTVSIAPGGTASTTLHTNAAGTGGSCTASSAKIRVYPPDNTVAVDFAASYSACGQFNVTTLVAGDGGR